MRFHLLALPNAQTTREYSLDGFAMATIRFSRLLKELGHTVFLYASEENEAPCDELIAMITKEEQQTLLGTNGTPYQYAYIDERSPLFQLGNARAISEIAKRKQPRDFICVIGGASQKPVADAHPDLMCVEYSIGYTGSFAPYRVFESHAWRHSTYGFQGMEDGRFFDAVIPCHFDLEEFPFTREPGAYALYVGRLTERKGIAIACAAAEAAGVPLKIIGHGNTSLITYGEYLGPLDLAARNRVMSDALAVLCPTIYIEPFCCVAVEAQLCGTPVIATDWGGFTETVLEGVSGFRCRYLGEFAAALRRAPFLDRVAIRSRARSLYSFEAVKPAYQRYFERLMLLWDRGWNSPELLPSDEELTGVRG